MTDANNRYGAGVEKRLVAFLSELTGVPEDRIKPETTLIDDLGMDSLDTIESLIGLEEEFGIEIMDADAEVCLTVGDAAALIQRVLSKPALPTPEPSHD